MYTFILECRRQFFRRNVGVVGVLLVVALLISLIGISDYNRMQVKISDFKKNDALLINSISTNEVYSEVGLNVAIIPSPTLILMTNPVMSTSQYGKVNSIITLDMDIKCKGRLNASMKSAFPLQPSSIFLYLGLLVVLVLGFETTWKKEYLKFLSSNSSRRTALLSAIAARLVFIFCGFAVIFGGVLLLLVISGIPIFNELSGLIAYAIATLIMLFISFLAGAILGNIRSIVKIIVCTFALWFVFVLLIPSLINKVIDMQNEKMDSFLALNAKHFKILMDFEAVAINKYGKPKDNTKEGRILVAEEFFKNQFQQMITLEEQYLKQLEAVNQKLENLSILTPTGLYILTTHEASSMGYGNMLKFYRALIQKRIAFMRYWINQVYYSSSKEVKSFVTKDENLFRMHSRVPDAFGKGILLNMVYFLILFFVADFVDKKSAFPAPTQKDAFDQLELNFGGGTPNVLMNFYKEIPEQLKNTFMGSPLSKDLKWKISIDGKKVTLGQRLNFLYLPYPDEFPGELYAGELLDYIKKTSTIDDTSYQKIKEGVAPLLKKRWNELEKVDKFTLLFAFIEVKMSTTKIFIVNNLAWNMHPDTSDQLLKLVKRFNDTDALIIYYLYDGAHFVIPNSRYTSFNFKNNKYSKMQVDGI